MGQALYISVHYFRSFSLKDMQAKSETGPQDVERLRLGTSLLGDVSWKPCVRGNASGLHLAAWEF